MSYHIKELTLLPLEKFDNYILDEKKQEKTKKKYDQVLKNLSKVNIFVGENNSGKSRFLRNLIFQSDSPYKFFPYLYGYERLQLELKDYIKEIDEVIIRRFGCKDYNEIRKLFEPRNIDEYLKSGSEHFDHFLMTLKKLLDKTPYIEPTDHKLTPSQVSNLRTDIISIIMKHEKLIPKLLTNIEIPFFRIYIPTLRGLKRLGRENKDDLIYSCRVWNDYFAGGYRKLNEDGKGEDFEIFTGLNMYEEVTELLLGNPEQRDIIKNFQKFLGDNFFQSQEITLMPRRKNKDLFVKIGIENEYPIQQLGDGIQTIIILTFPIFYNSGKDLLVFIEEPELYMHPGLQRQFLEILTKDKRFDKCQFFIATHSNHILDMTLDMDQLSVYTFRKKIEPSTENGPQKTIFIIKNINNDDNHVLSLLGVKNSSVFLSNCTIWVEGITDRLYIRKFFEIYQREKQKKGEPIFREDIHYSFVEYGGANITHWSFLDEYNESKEKDPPKSINVEKLCGRLFLIADKDSPKREPRHKSLEKCLGKERYYPLECREIENVLNEEVILSVISQYEKKTIDETIEIVGNIKSKDYFNKYLGVYIEKKLGDKKTHNYISTKSKALTDKVNFCKRALQCIDSIDNYQLPAGARTICEKIYAFVKQENS